MQAVQSRQLRKLQLARGGFGLSKEMQNSGRVAEILVRQLLPHMTEYLYYTQSLMCPSISHEMSSANVVDPSPT